MSSSSGSQRENSLRLSERQLANVMDRLDTDAGPQHPLRQFTRFPFRRACIPMRVEQPSAQPFIVRVAARNLSRTGMSVLHSAYLYPDFPCAVALVANDKSPVKINARIVRCQHRFDGIHEIGIRFLEELDVGRFRPPDPIKPMFSLERIDSKQLEGRIAHICDSEFDCALLRHMLKETLIRVVEIETREEALERHEEQFHVVVLDYGFGRATADSLVMDLKERGCQLPMLMITGDTSRSSFARITGAGVDGVLSKPLDQNELLRAIGEYTVINKVESEAGRKQSNTRTPGLVLAFKRCLPQRVQLLEEAVAAGDSEAAAVICAEISAASATLGFSQIQQLAADAVEHLNSGGSIAAAAEYIEPLVASCRRAA